MNVEEIKELKDKIEILSKSYQIEIGRLLLSNGVQIDENKNGIFINLTKVEQEVLIKIKDYLAYANIQEDKLKNIENKQEELKDYYFKNNNESEVKST
jgi:hypothetical protein|tara:strand:+ start:193 stop:486 length:294 start_codon:yes stop_codon:yes gene_type:complete